jgi:hypothetical protein
VVKVVQSVECSTLTTRAWPTPLTGGSTADGMISPVRCAQDSANATDQAARRARSPCHWRAINEGDPESVTVTTGYPNPQASAHDGHARYTFQAGHEGSIPFARSLSCRKTSE